MVKIAPYMWRAGVYDATLPLTAKPTGVICRYLQDSMYSGYYPGALLTPCRKVPEGDSTTFPCAAGLTCGEVASDIRKLCLKVCAADADCPLDGLLKCDGGVCVLKETW